MIEATIQLAGPLDPRGSWAAEPCSLAKSLDVLRTRSTFLIMREAFYGTTRFEDFAERLGLSDPVTAARLRDLVEQGLLRREDYREAGKRTRQLYRLTEKGSELFPALAALVQWGDRWENDERRVEFRHRGCGARAEVELRCSAGHRLETADVELVLR